MIDKYFNSVPGKVSGNQKVFQEHNSNNLTSSMSYDSTDVVLYQSIHFTDT
jgi:hypothetical protein